MRLIDADKLHYKKVCIRHEYDEKSTIVVFAKEIDKAEEVKAIPIEWIEQFMNRFRLDMVTSDEYVLLHFMLTEWENENE